MIKETKRKGFNFYRSYYDVFNELNDKDKLTFIKALLDKQFLDIEPTNLNGMVKFAWISQQNSIEQQLKGYKSKTKDPMQGACQGGTQGACQGGSARGDLPPSLQEKEKEKEKVEYTIQSKIDFNALLDLINTHTKRKFTVINKNIQAKYKARLKDGYTKDDIKNTIINSVSDQFHKDNNFKYLTPDYFSRAKTIDQYSHIGKTSTQSKTWSVANHLKQQNK